MTVHDMRGKDTFETKQFISEEDIWPQDIVLTNFEGHSIFMHFNGDGTITSYIDDGEYYSESVVCTHEVWP